VHDAAGAPVALPWPDVVGSTGAREFTLVLGGVGTEGQGLLLDGRPATGGAGVATLLAPAGGLPAALTSIPGLGPVGQLAGLAGFATIVASGPHSAVPHHAPTDRPFADGDLVTVDAGALVDGYHADMTRTFAIGRPDPVLAGIHALVERAAAAGREAVRGDVSASRVDDAARGVIERAGHGERFVHPTGHGVGLDIHEAPAVARGSTATLRPTMVLTVEPGVYLPGLGGVRIEDCLLVTSEAPEVLTEHPRGLEHD
jgi:Xaa-Pro aminopeptidase